MTSATALPRSVRLGRRVADARRDAGLTQTALAERLRLPLWALERIERGEEDGSHLVARVAAATGKPESWFRDALGAGPSKAPAAAPRSAHRRSRAVPAGLLSARAVLLGAITLLFVIRFFTEVIPVVPRFLNFVDVPVFATVLALAVLRRPEPPARPLAGSPFFPAVVFFLGLCAVSTIANADRVAPAPVLLFVYGFVAPLAVFYAAYRLWPAGHSRDLSRLIVGLALVEFVVVATISLPRAVSTDNPDEISGTFGEGPYQLVFFLIVFAALLAGISTFEPRRPVVRLAPLLFGASFVVIFLAQYRALLLTTILSVLLVGALLGAARGRGFLVGSAIIATCLVGFVGVATYFPVSKFATTIEGFRSDPAAIVGQRVGIFEDVLQVYGDEPAAVVVGTGPGTYSSRAWRTFGEIFSTSKSDVAGPYVRALTGGRAYVTDVSQRYVQPRFRHAEAVLGTNALGLPWSSYSSLLAEVGVLGFALVVGVYLTALARAARMAVHSMRTAVPGDPLPALLLASTISFFVLLQMAIFENWLEVARVTLPTWIVFAIVSKEFQARREASA